MATPQPHATPEQVEALHALLRTWEALLDDVETYLRASPTTEGPAGPAPTPIHKELAMSRRILTNYRRTLARDLERGLQHLPASEVGRASGTAEASISRLRVLQGGLSAL